MLQTDLLPEETIQEPPVSIEPEVAPIIKETPKKTIPPTAPKDNPIITAPISETDKVLKEIDELNKKYEEKLNKASELDNLFSSISIINSGLSKLDAGNLNVKSGTSVKPVESQAIDTNFAEREVTKLKPMLEERASLLDKYKELSKPKENKYMQVGNNVVTITPSGDIKTLPLGEPEAKYSTVKSSDGSIWRVNLKDPEDKQQILEPKVSPEETRRQEEAVEKYIQGYDKNTKVQKDTLSSINELENLYGFRLEDYSKKENSVLEVDPDTGKKTKREVNLPYIANVPLLGKTAAPFTKGANIRDAEQGVINYVIKQFSGAAVSEQEAKRLAIDLAEGKFSTEADRIFAFKRLKDIVNKAMLERYKAQKPEVQEQLKSRGITPPIMQKNILAIEKKTGKTISLPGEEYYEFLSKDLIKPLE